MPLSADEMNSIRLKRREAFLRMVAVFTSLLAAAVMVILLVQLVNKRVADRRRAEAAARDEREHYEASTASTRSVADAADPAGRPPGREIRPVTDVVDMSTRSASGRFPRVPSSGRGGPVENLPRSQASSSAGGIENLDHKQPAIADVLRDFFGARAVGEMLPLVRDARRVRPLMEEFYKRNPVREWKWKGIGWAIPVEEPGYRFAYVQATFADSSPVNVVIEETETGFFVDWESSVQYSELGWKEFMSKRPDQPKVFRVIASRLESGEAGSAGGDAVLTLKHPQEEGIVLGRFNPGDPRFRPLVEQLDLCKWKDVPVILRLCYPGPASGGNEVQIAGVEGKGWLILGDRSRG